MTELSLQCVATGGVVDLPGGDTEPGQQLLVWQDWHGGYNQRWRWQESDGGGAIVSVLCEETVVAVGEAGRVVVGRRGGPGTRWTRQQDCVLAEDGRVLTDRAGKLVLEQRRNHSPHQTWLLQVGKNKPFGNLRL